MKIKRTHILVLLLAALTLSLPFKKNISQALSPLTNWLMGRATIEDRIEQYGDEAQLRLRPYFQKAGTSYPPKEIVLVGLKKEKLLEVWVRDDRQDNFVIVRQYSVLGSSGKLGPKLQEGDRQVPEGIYRVDSLHPNSSFHLALRLNYPNEFDLLHAKQDGRNSPGSDIMIHGSTASIGCLAMGDETIEELFVMAADTGIENIKVVLAPLDLRKSDLPPTNSDLPTWSGSLYTKLRDELAQLKPQKQTADALTNE